MANELIKKKVLPHFFATLLVTFISMVFGMFFVPPGVAFICSIAVLVILVIYVLSSIFGGKKRVSDYGVVFPMPLVYFFSALLGIGLHPTIQYYLSSMGADLVLAALGTTVILFGVLATYAYFTKRDFSFLGMFLFISLLGLIILSIIGLFMPNAELFWLLISMAGVIIFSGYILYDISRMKNSNFTEKDVPAAVFDLYLDFINIFLDLLRIYNFFFGDD